jgi:hypothetical protein
MKRLISTGGEGLVPPVPNKGTGMDHDSSQAVSSLTGTARSAILAAVPGVLILISGMLAPVPSARAYPNIDFDVDGFDRCIADWANQHRNDVPRPQGVPDYAVEACCVQANGIWAPVQLENGGWVADCQAPPADQGGDAVSPRPTAPPRATAIPPDRGQLQ